MEGDWQEETLRAELFPHGRLGLRWQLSPKEPIPCNVECNSFP